MDKLNVPSWYKTSHLTTAPSTPNLLTSTSSSSSTLPAMTSSWRTASMTTSAGWRRQSTQQSAASTLDRQSCLVNSQRFRSRGSTLPASPSAHNLSPSKMYLGWRSQERLDIGPAYLTSPTQRLASSAVVVNDKPGKEKQVNKDIKEVTEAIIDFCSSPVNDKPMTVKQAWVSNDDDSDNSDNPDDDSGIDRSDDFTHDILNEA